MGSPFRPLVVIVDDDQDARDMYGEYLAANGFRVLTARNGMEGFTRSYESLPDVLVTDLILPSIDGWELVRRVKADDRTKDIPVVVVTGWATDALQEQARQHGCASFLIKPCLPDALADEIQKVLRTPRPAVVRQ